MGRTLMASGYSRRLLIWPMYDSTTDGQTTAFQLLITVCFVFVVCVCERERERGREGG